MNRSFVYGPKKLHNSKWFGDFLLIFLPDWMSGPCEGQVNEVCDRASSCLLTLFFLWTALNIARKKRWSIVLCDEAAILKHPYSVESHGSPKPNPSGKTDFTRRRQVLESKRYFVTQCHAWLNAMWIAGKLAYKNSVILLLIYSVRLCHWCHKYFIMNHRWNDRTSEPNRPFGDTANLTFGQERNDYVRGMIDEKMGGAVWHGKLNARLHL